MENERETAGKGRDGLLGRFKVVALARAPRDVAGDQIIFRSLLMV